MIEERMSAAGSTAVLTRANAASIKGSFSAANKPLRRVLARIDQPFLQKPGDPDHLLRKLCDRVAARFAVSAAEIRTASLRRPVLHARVVVSRIAVSHCGLSLTAIGRHLNVSKQSIARDLRRLEAVLAEHDYSATDFIVG